MIKPNDEYGGTGVTLGWETSEADWDAAIARALAERDRGWVAQERIAVRREMFPVCDGSARRRAVTCATCWSISRRTSSAASSPAS